MCSVNGDWKFKKRRFIEKSKSYLVIVYENGFRYFKMLKWDILGKKRI